MGKTDSPVFKCSLYIFRCCLPGWVSRRIPLTFRYLLGVVEPVPRNVTIGNCGKLLALLSSSRIRTCSWTLAMLSLTPSRECISYCISLSLTFSTRPTTSTLGGRASKRSPDWACFTMPVRVELHFRVDKSSFWTFKRLGNIWGHIARSFWLYIR